MENAAAAPMLSADPTIGRACSIDTETTGLDPRNDRIISFGHVELVDGRIGTSTEWFFNPGTTPIHPDALKVHGITMEFLADKPPIKAYLPRIIELVVEAVICGHNVKFDLEMINAELLRNRFPPLEEFIAGMYDTMVEAKARWPGKPANLNAVCDRLGIATSHRQLHGALTDAMLCARAVLAMRQGQRSLLDLVPTQPGDDAEGQCVIATPIGQVTILAATGNEITEHEAYLKAMSSNTGVHAIWDELTVDSDAPDLGPRPS